MPAHPRDRFGRKTNDEIKFIKQVSLHPLERLKRKRKHALDDDGQLSKKRKNNDEVTFIKHVPVHPHRSRRKLASLDEKVHFIKQIPSHPRNRLKRNRRTTVMKNINRQIEAVANNTNKFLLGEFNFSPKNILNKT